MKTWVAGAVLPAAEMNTYLGDNGTALRAGGLAIASQAANDVPYATSSTQLGRVAAGTAGQVLAAGSGGVPAMVGGLTLLKANSGTTTSTSAENVDTYALASQLTAKDTLLVFLTFEAVTQAAGTLAVYNSTDSVVLHQVGASLAAGVGAQVMAQSRQAQSAATKVHSGLGVFGDCTVATFATAWTGAWTVALRQGGVTAGGTLKWSWAVYRVAGQ